MKKTKPIPRFSKYTVSEDGRIFNKISGVEITQTKDPRHYYYVTIMNDSGKWEKKRVHVIVGEVFHGKRPSELHIYDHDDGNKDNNHKDNLILTTKSINTQKWHNARKTGGYSHTGLRYEDRHKNKTN